LNSSFTLKAEKDSAAWEEVKYSDRELDFQRYLKEFPSGMFVRLAESQMRSLIERKTNRPPPAKPPPVFNWGITIRS
tara:strand:+ start:342 stop:572 length:231 start_codon:yes stop_codon:yes gene_type:complete